MNDDIAKEFLPGIEEISIAHENEYSPADTFGIEIYDLDIIHD